MHKDLSFKYKPWPCFCVYRLDENMRAINPSSKFFHGLIIMPCFVVAFLRQESLKHEASVNRPFEVSKSWGEGVECKGLRIRLTMTSPVYQLLLFTSITLVQELLTHLAMYARVCQCIILSVCKMHYMIHIIQKHDNDIPNGNFSNVFSCSNLQTICSNSPMHKSYRVGESGLSCLIPILIINLLEMAYYLLIDSRNCMHIDLVSWLIQMPPKLLMIHHMKLFLLDALIFFLS